MQGAKTGTKKSQAHKNTHTYELLYRDDKKDLQKNAILDRVCTRCLEILQWKLKFGKYKPLKAAKKCQKCLQTTVLKPYRTLCNKCADCNKCCSKCGDKKEFDIESFKYAPINVVNRRVQAMQANIKMMQERSKRTINRLLFEDLIRFREGKFMYKADNRLITNIYYKRKFWEELGIEEPRGGEDCDYNEEDDNEAEGEDDVNLTEEKQARAVEDEVNKTEESTPTPQPVKPVERLQAPAKAPDAKDLVEERSGVTINF